MPKIIPTAPRVLMAAFMNWWLFNMSLIAVNIVAILSVILTDILSKFCPVVQVFDDHLHDEVSERTGNHGYNTDLQ
jgi:hypothetical protein